MLYFNQIFMDVQEHYCCDIHVPFQSTQLSFYVVAHYRIKPIMTSDNWNQIPQITRTTNAKSTHIPNEGKTYDDIFFVSASCDQKWVTVTKPSMDRYTSIEFIIMQFGISCLKLSNIKIPFDVILRSFSYSSKQLSSCRSIICSLKSKQSPELVHVQSINTQHLLFLLLVVGH